MSFPTTEKILVHGIAESTHVHYQHTPEDLVQQTLDRHQGELNNTGALVINTGEFTGRSPADKFIVKDSITADTIHWNNCGIAIAVVPSHAK